MLLSHGVRWSCTSLLHILMAPDMFSCIMPNISSISTVSLSKSAMTWLVIVSSLYGSSSGASRSSDCICVLIVVYVCRRLTKEVLMVWRCSISLCMMVSMVSVWCLVVGSLIWGCDFIGCKCGGWVAITMGYSIFTWELMQIGWLRLW